MRDLAGAAFIVSGILLFAAGVYTGVVYLTVQAFDTDPAEGVAVLLLWLVPTLIALGCWLVDE